MKSLLLFIGARAPFVAAATLLLSLCALEPMDLAAGPLESEGCYGQGHAKFHDTFYKHLIRPDTGGSCCSGKECRPTSGRMIGGHYEVKVDGVWVPVPWNKIVKETAPDGGYHVCAPIFFKQPHQLFCVVIAPEG